MRKRYLVAVIAALLTTSLPTSIASAHPVDAAAPQVPVQSVAWQECGTTFKGECATIKVPVDWGNSTGETIDLAIGRLKALDPAKRIGVLLAWPGGPGGSGINSYITGRTIPDDSPLRQRFDIISVDPRGVARSNPIQCSEDLVAKTPFTYPVSESEYQTWLGFNALLSDDCRRNTGSLADHADSVSAARDADAIRAALGEQKLSFFAISYGTLLGELYAELFPQRIRAMAIDSNMDHSITDPYRYLETTTQDFEGSFTEFTKWCDRTTACALHGEQVSSVWKSLYAKAEAGTLVDPETGSLIDAESLRAELFLPMFNPKKDWFGLAGRLKSLRDGSPADRSVVAKPAATIEYSYPTIWCSDWQWNVQGFAQLDEYRRRLEGIAPNTRLSPFWFDVMTCLNWPGRVNNPQHRLKISGVPPILVVKARYDVAAPAAWNNAVAEQIPNSVLLEYDGAGHGVYRISSCARAKIEHYLITLATPAKGTHCPAEYPTEPSAAAESDSGTEEALTPRWAHLR